MAKKEQQTKSTQSYLTISNIKQDTLITESGELCAVVAVSSTNFALKSQEEQDALIYGYQSFLNSLDFPIQILMQSRKIDIHIYLEKVKKIMEQQTNELLRVQTAEYIEFITQLIENASIMNKNFYIIISYSAAKIDNKKTKNFLSFFKRTDAKGQATEKLKDFQEQRLKLDQRINTVIGGLSSLGLKCLTLKTPEITELLYNSYNMDSGPLINSGNLENIKLSEQK